MTIYKAPCDLPSLCYLTHPFHTGTCCSSKTCRKVLLKGLSLFPTNSRVAPFPLIFLPSPFSSSPVHFSTPELPVDKSHRHVGFHLPLLLPLGPFLGLLGWFPLLSLTSIFCVLSLLFSSVHVLQRENLIHFMTVNTTSVLCAADFQIKISSPNLSSALNTWISSYEPVILWMSPLPYAEHVFSQSCLSPSSVAQNRAPPST